MYFCTNRTLSLPVQSFLLLFILFDPSLPIPRPKTLLSVLGPFLVRFRFSCISPISYRPGLSVLSEDSAPSTPPQLPPGPPNRPLPPTPDDDAQGDRTLIMKKVNYKRRLCGNIVFCVSTGHDFKWRGRYCSRGNS